jgi:hypothetical protein
MSAPRKPPIPEIQVDDPAAAMKRMQAFGKRILAVPKREVDAKNLAKKPKKR